MDVRTYFGALWVEFSTIVLEDCKLYFMPWRQARDVSDIRYR